jgi:hypothetical protein
VGKPRVRPLLWRGARNSPGQDRLHTVEQVLGDQGLEVAAFCANAVLCDVHDAGIELVPQQHADRLRCQRMTGPIGQTPGLCLLEHLLLGETPCCVLLEYAAHNRRAFGVGYQALAHRARGVHVPDRRKERPPSKFQRGFHAGAGPV